MDRSYWTDDVVALALTTPLDQIRIDEISSTQLRRLSDLIEEVHNDPAHASAGFEKRYHLLRALLDSSPSD